MLDQDSGINLFENFIPNLVVGLTIRLFFKFNHGTIIQFCNNFILLV